MRKTFLLFFTLLFCADILYAQEKKTTMHFAYYMPSMINVKGKDVKISLGFWAQELADVVNVDIKNHFYKDIDKLRADIEAKKVDMVSASHLIFATELNSDLFQDGFETVTNDEKSNNKLLLLTHYDSSIDSLKALKGKKVARIKNHDMEKLYIDTQLKKAQKQISDRYFGKNIYVKQYSKAILKLFFKKVDAAFVTQSSFDLAAELNPQIKKKLRVLESADLHLKSFALFRKGVEQEKIDIFFKEALRLHESQRGKQILTVFKADRIKKSDINDLKSVRALYNEYLALNK